MEEVRSCTPIQNQPRDRDRGRHSDQFLTSRSESSLPAKANRRVDFPAPGGPRSKVILAKSKQATGREIFRRYNKTAVVLLHFFIMLQQMQIIITTEEKKAKLMPLCMNNRWIHEKQ